MVWFICAECGLVFSVCLSVTMKTQICGEQPWQLQKAINSTEGQLCPRLEVVYFLNKPLVVQPQRDNYRETQKHSQPLEYLWLSLTQLNNPIICCDLFTVISYQTNDQPVIVRVIHSTSTSHHLDNSKTREIYPVIWIVFEKNTKLWGQSCRYFKQTVTLVNQNSIYNRLPNLCVVS